MPRNHPRDRIPPISPFSFHNKECLKFSTNEISLNQYILHDDMENLQFKTLVSRTCIHNKHMKLQKINLHMDSVL